MALTEPTGTPPRREQLDTGVVLHGTVWAGGAAEPLLDGVVVVDAAGRVAALGPAGSVPLPEGLRRLGGPDAWIGPGVVDAHVHLAFASPEQMLTGGVVAVRDLGAPPELVAELRSRTGPPAVHLAGPVLTAPTGYPSRTWGSGGFAAFLDDAAVARTLVGRLVDDGVDVVKVAVEPAGGQPVPGRAELRAVVDAAHERGLRVTAHALTAAAVGRVLDAEVDELAHTPTEPLDDALLERIADAGMVVVSTLQTLAGPPNADGSPSAVVRNAAALHAAGVRLVYGTDLGNAGTVPGVDPRELDRLAAAGLGRLGALRAATEGSARLLGRSGVLAPGAAADLVLLPCDPLVQPEAWRSPSAVVTAGRLLLPAD
ncbi:MAG TPA: amidohydrolase family protein [Mycobacteriales bacterium]|nr:amidohydrolase family protein [Mycobacteriales bacterium]